MDEIAVAVVLCSGGNHSAEMAGGAPMAIGPPRPFRNCPICINLENNKAHNNYSLFTYENYGMITAGVLLDIDRNYVFQLEYYSTWKMMKIPH